MIPAEQLTLFMLVLTRVSAFIAFFPLFSKRQLPNLVKVGMAASLAIFWTLEVNTSVDTSEIGDLASLMGMLMIFKEMMIGTILSMALGLFFWPSKIAGAYVGQELGLSLASISDPGSQDSSTLVTRLFDTFLILMFFSLNLHHFIILVIHESFQHFLTSANLFELPTEYMAQCMNVVNDYGLLIAAPLMILFMMVTLVLAFLNKAAPSLNLFTVGMSLRAGLGVFCLFLFCPIVFAAMQTYLFRVQDDIEELLRMM
ncbi:flagellar biosynthetic protein FliR [Planctomycetes bacterium K23_9]|uniref:Flagellar biosynthesis protein FliR n=1 Tax=Stieleria marina TaxID=1930275 RepID=A0A517NVQ7_9BACT|nr:flagellar biosynthesis protein FliR [Planctomycetes bacterium K23_9]